MEKTCNRSKPYQPFHAGKAYWNQRHELAANHKRIFELFQAVDRSRDLYAYQWAQLIAAALEFKPDLILELGRGRGNSTCVFTEAAQHLSPQKTKVVSLCLSDDWEQLTKPKVSKVVPPSWFELLETIQCNILSFDYKLLLSKSERCLIFWDAHGFEVAECVLGKILPLILEKEHLVTIHDLSDARYHDRSDYYYRNKPLWKKNDWSGPRLRLWNIDSAVEEAIAIVDFASRNELKLHSADEDIHTEFASNAQKKSEMVKLLGPEMFSLSAQWFHFSLHERSGTFTFPFFEPSRYNNTSAIWENFKLRMRKIKRLIARA